MNTKLVVVLLLLTYTFGCNCQAFQYSRGWSGGKRSELLHPLLVDRLAAEYIHCPCAFIRPFARIAPTDDVSDDIGGVPIQANERPNH